MRRLCTALVVAALSGPGSFTSPEPGLQAAQAAGQVDRLARPGLQAPARDTRPDPGTAVIRGRVVAADTGAPLRRVLVQAGGGRNGRSTTTDAEGRFELPELPAGRYTIRASKAGYVSLSFGQRRPFEPGRPVELRPGEVVERVDLALPRGAVITGRVTDEVGDPVAEIRVQAMRYRFVAGRRRLVPVAGGQTNDIGEYRLFGLPPGQYLVTAAPRSGPGGEGFNPADPGGFAPTFYPGTPAATDAQPVLLGLGAQANADIPLVPTRLARITGTVIDSSGRPYTAGMVAVRAANRDLGVGLDPRGARLRSDGTFSIGNVPPGEYILSYRTDPRAGDGGEFGARSVLVSGGDVGAVVIATSPGATVAGRVVGENGQALSIPAAGLRIVAVPEDQGGGPVARPRPAPVQDDWSFELRNLSEPVLFRVNGAPSGWSLKAVRMDGRDVTDQVVDASQAGRGIEVVLTSRVTELSGVVLDARGVPVPDYAAVIFSEDERLWTAPQSRHVRSARPDQEGRFAVRGLPAGSYLAVALEYAEDGEASDPEALDRWRGFASSVRLEDGETKTIELKLTPRP